MQQHLMQMQPMMAAYYPNNVTTDHIQQGYLIKSLEKYLDENKSLILKIVESQNSGKLGECAENQARLQRNLMYLAAIADSQPQPPTLHPQYASSGVVQPGAHYMQHQQAQQLTPQSVMAARSSLLYAQQPYLQQQQVLHSQLGMSSGSAGLHLLQSEGANAEGSGALRVGAYADFGRGSSGEGLHVGSRGMAGGSSKQDIGSAEGRGGSSGGQGGDAGETLYPKGGDDSN